MAIEDQSAQNRDRAPIPGQGAARTFRHADKQDRAASNERCLGDGKPDKTGERE